MLVLSRRRGEIIDVGADIQIMVVDIRNGNVRLGIQAPPEVMVHRREITLRRQDEAEGGK